MRRVVVGSACATLFLAGCFFGGGDDEEDVSSLPLPQQPPAAAGPAVGPEMEAKALFAAADELEEQTGALDTAQVERRSGALISGEIAVGYSVDDISGYDLESGDQLWTAELDLKGGTVCFVSEPDRAVKHVTVVHGENGFCSQIATIRVSDGEVVAQSDAMSSLAEFEGESAGGSVNAMFTVDGVDHLVDMRGVVWRMGKGEPKPVSRLEDDNYFNLHTTPDGSMLIGSRLSDPACRVDAYELPSFEHAWTTEGAQAFPEQGDDCVVSLAPGDPTWLMQQIGSEYHMAKLDPSSGEPVGSVSAPQSAQEPVPEGTFDVASASNQFDRTLGVGDGEMIFAQARGLSRYSLETEEMAWELDLTQLELASEDEYALTTVLPQGLTDDGLLVATVSNDTAAEVIAVDAEKGTLVGRWALPEEYRNGFQVQPAATFYDGGLVLTRNFEAWEFAFADYKEAKPPEGDLFDIGVFTFPPPGESVEPQAAPVPTAGPVQAEAESLASVEADELDEEVSAGAVYTGDAVVTYSGPRLQGFDKSGEELWSSTLQGGAGAEVCSTSEPDRRTKAIVLTYRQGDGDCTGLMRVGARGGTVQEVALPDGAESIYSIVTHAGTDYVITEENVVGTIEDGEFQEIADLGRSFIGWTSTPEDPDLLLATTATGKGNERTVQAFRVPTFEKAWSRTASDLFDKELQKDNFVTLWAGNGLWASASFGDYSDPDADITDALVKLDPGTGETVAETGVQERDYLADDLAEFVLSAASTAGSDTVGFDDGSVVLPQRKGIMRYSLEDDEILWTLDTSSITKSMEKARRGTYLTETYDLIDNGRSILVTLSNEISTELMTLDPDDGTITGRWKLGDDVRNGLQVDPDVTAWAGGVALTRSSYAWLSAYGPAAENDPPKGPVRDVGLFGLPPQKPAE